MNTAELINILIYYHLQQCSTSTEVIQTLQDDDYASQFVAPPSGVKQLLAIFTELQKLVAGTLPS